MIAGTSSFIVMTILGVPFAAPLAVFAGLMSLIPLIGATIAAVIIGLVTLFNDFPTDTVIWTIWAIAYQQIENNFVQPQIQRRTVNVQPFVVLVAVLFGQTLLGVLGRPRRDPHRGVHPDHDPRVVGLPSGAARSGRPAARAASGSRLTPRLSGDSGHGRRIRPSGKRQSEVPDVK